MTPRPPQDCEYMTPEDALKLRLLLDKHELILALVEAAERRTWLWARARYWIIFLAGVYAVATSGIKDVIAKIVKVI